MWRFLKYFFLFLVLLCLLLAGAVAGGLYYLVVLHPGEEISQKNIQSILGRESPVYYRDGQEKIGVLFQTYHRQYLRYEQIPPRFIQALVAAEDNRFFHHYGIDPAGILRAVIANIKAGRVVQGGSTITQQTAKNLFKRQSRSFQAKLKELLYALRLEYHYPKEKILEFYCNQFFVSGNGHGLGVAARYYFDKDPSELTLLENAFIAGSVKRPNYYNPFTKKNKKRPEVARKRSEKRAAYVLKNMLRLAMITREEYEGALYSDLVFKQGRMAYALNTIMDLVRDALSSPAMTEILAEQGISNVSTSGVRIITSVDHDLQTKTLLALRRRLSYLDVRLRGYKRGEVQKQYAARELTRKKEVVPGDFLLATVKQVHDAKKKKQELLTVDLGDELPDGLVDHEGVERLLDAYVKHAGKRWTKVKKSRDLPRLLGQFRSGDRVFVSVREIDDEGKIFLDLERYPAIEGAALILQKGAVRAIAGGMENRYFNRAIDARRLMGSTFKPFLFAAALQLGWNTVDSLDNRRNIFVFMDRPYFPRPDHHSPFKEVSMSWAGVHSENVAAVWLLYHLADHLTPPRLLEVARHVDMAPRVYDNGEVEPYRLFAARIRDTFGISLSRDVLRRAAYEQAVRGLEADFLFEGRARQYAQLKQLPYGLHFDRFLEPVRAALKDKKLKPRQRAELLLRKSLLEKSYLGLEPMLPLVQAWQAYMAEFQDWQDGFSFSTVRPKRPEGRLVRDGQGNVVLTLKKKLPEGWVPLDDNSVLSMLWELDRDGIKRFWKSVLLEGAVCECAYEQVRVQMERELEHLVAARPYSMEVLATIRDYRVMLGLQYLRSLGRQSGIKSRLKPVLSFPLGSNVVTLAELTKMYETLVHGVFFQNGPEAGPEDTAAAVQDDPAIIERIEGPDGRVIYARSVTGLRVFDQGGAAAVSHVLQNVVRYGTGRYAHDHVRLHSLDPEREKELAGFKLAVPLLGKTGTANDFRNATFVGYVPAPDDADMIFPGGYTMGVYVGFDKNRPMKIGNTHVTGSLGALPIWSDMAGAVLSLEGAGDRLDPVDLTFNGLGLRYPETGQLFVPVDPGDGGRIVPGRGARHALVAPDIPVILSYGNVSQGGHFEPARWFRPFWHNRKQRDTD